MSEILFMGTHQAVDLAVEEVYRSEWGRIVATLIRIFNDFELAEDLAQEAFAAAVDQWRVAGVPELPRAWIVQTARHKGIDRLRRQIRFAETVQSLPSAFNHTVEEPGYDTSQIPDDRLQLIFTCCHPALASDAQIALTLRTLGGLETDEIARAFLVSPPAMAQRLVRAKHKIRDAGIPYRIPGLDEMPERVGAVLTVIYLIFNEGYAATRGQSLVRTDLCGEAMRLARLVRTLMSPPPREATGLLALMLFHDARRNARLDQDGELVLLEDQDRSRWDRSQIHEAIPLVDEALGGSPGPYALQAAIAALHCQAKRAEDTDWPQILRLYEFLERLEPSPIVTLNRAVAVAMVHGCRPALAFLDASTGIAALDSYHLLHATRADLLRRLGSSEEAAKSYRRALSLVTNESERRFLERRLREVQSPGRDINLAR